MKKLKYLPSFLFLSFIFFTAFMDPQVPAYTPEDGHFIKSYSAWNNLVVLDDDSVWVASTTKVFLEAKWLINDPVLITLNTDYFSDSSYKYKFTNFSRNEYFYANIQETPLLKNPKTYLIQLLDRQKGVIGIDHNVKPFFSSTWQVDSQDINKLQKWELKDAVLIAKNNEAPSFWSYFFNIEPPTPHILINESVNDFVRVKIIK